MGVDCTVNVEASSLNCYDDIAQGYFYVMSNAKEEWQNSQITQTVRLLGDNSETKGYLYRVGNSSNQNGYFVVTNLFGKITVSESTLYGEDPLKENPKSNYYIAPFGFYTSEEYEAYKLKHKNEHQNTITLSASVHDSYEVMLLDSSDPLDPDNLIPVPSSYYSSYSISFYSEQLITDTPEYFNFDYGPVNNGCGPTTAAMLTSFYDRVVLTNLISGQLPLDHRTPSGPDPDVDEHIITMADYLDTCNNINGNLADPDNCTGTSYLDAMDGFEEYFDDQGYGTYNAFYSTDLSDYYALIQAANVSYMRIWDDMGTPSTFDDLRHAVLGIGSCNVYGIGPQLLVRFNWTTRDGEYMISPSLFVGIIYMSEADA